MCRDEDRRPVSKGVVLGIIAIPLGLLRGFDCRAARTDDFDQFGAGYCHSRGTGRYFDCFPEPTLAGFKTFGDILKCICILSLTLASLEEALGITLLPGMDPLGEQLKIIGLIGVTLAEHIRLSVYSAGACPRCCAAWGRYWTSAMPQWPESLHPFANPLPMFDLISEMDDRGKVVAMAFAVPALAVFGDHMGYVSAVCPDAVIPLAAGKLTAGIVGLILAEIFESAPLFRPNERNCKNRSRM